MGIEYKDAPGMLSRNKSKMTAALSTNEKKQNRCNFSVDIEKKMLDGQPVVVCRMNNYMCFSIGNTQPLQEEFTDVKKFAQAIHDKIVTVGDEL